MATEVVLKDIGDVFARVFDHRPIIQGEINYTLSEFETKRGNSENTRLQNILENTRETNEKLIPDCKKKMDESLPAIVEKFKIASSLCSGILSKEGTTGKDEWLLDQRGDRVDRWSSFMDEMCEASEKVDQEYEAEVQRVKLYYEDVEKHLNINK